MNPKKRTRFGIVLGILTTGLLVIAGLLLVRPTPVKAWANAPCDFMTGGGWIVNRGFKANFGVGGGCKNGSPTWGHLEYHDHGTGLDAHWTAITAYELDDDGSNGTSSSGQPIGTRLICGNATTNQFGDVYFVVRARDAGEPGVNDQFDIRMRSQKDPTIVVYDTTTLCAPHYLGSYACSAPGSGGGGNIQLHKPNPSTSGSFGGSCPGL
jgi:hypothetical protein